MQTMNTKGNIIKLVILAALVLPLIFGAEVMFVEKQYVTELNQIQDAKLRAEAEVYWLSGQTTYLRSIAKINAVSLSDPEALPTDLRSFQTTELAALGYAGADGKVQFDTSQSGVQNIAGKNYFVDAAAGREFMGRVTGTDWLLSEEVTVIAVPATVDGVVTGVFYGVIRQETIEAMFANLAPVGISEQQVAGRWLAWLAGMYLLGIIPLLALGYLLRRSREVVELPFEAARSKTAEREKLRTRKAPRPMGNRVAPGLLPDEEAGLFIKDFGGTASEPPESIAVRKIAEIIALNSADADQAAEKKSLPDSDAAAAKTLAATKLIERIAAETANVASEAGTVSFAGDAAKTTRIIAAKKRQNNMAAEVVAPTPAAVIDKMLAAAAYKGSRAAAQKEPVIPSEFEPIAAQLRKLKSEPKLEPQIEPAETNTIDRQELVEKQQQRLAATEFKTMSMDDLPAGDGLTTLYTRSVFEKKIAARYGKPDIGFIVLSIDGMKVINDFLGNLAGDTIITAAADILKQVAGSDCIAARMDGDRFVAMFYEVSPEALEDVKKDIKYNIDLHNLRHPELPLSITTGTTMAKTGESLAAAWERAIQEMESRKPVNREEARKFIMMSIKRHRRKS
ncbi:MAG: diguanylate cyclase and metal dependent phosphohydrolase [Firmicutes bacterium]|nr:diguanylate cyclase and metal dependent phosphohydrolase [Bacillota bacterium]